MLNLRYSRGFTLIEISIALGLTAILLFLAVPSFTGWIANTKVRSVADALKNGLLAAQTESVRRGRQTGFVLTNAAPALDAAANANGTNWYIQVAPAAEPDRFVQGGSFASLAPGVTITASDTVICFNSIGRLVASIVADTDLAADCTVPAVAPFLVTYDVASTAADRKLRVSVGLGGQIRMCDLNKTLSAANPDGC